jgi:hypothetical protein
MNELHDACDLYCIHAYLLSDIFPTKWSSELWRHIAKRQALP